MAVVECVTLDGSVKLVDRKDLLLRPAAYAIIVSAGRLLLLRLRPTMKYHLPGGGIEGGESAGDALRREVREETGVEIQVGALGHYKEVYFYYDPSGRAYHGLHLYYLCRALTTSLLRDDEVEDGSAKGPRWVELAALRPEDFQLHGAMILRLTRGLAA